MTSLPISSGGDICSGLTYQMKGNFVFISMKRVKPVKLPLKISSDIAYLVGVIVGDGNMTVTDRGSICKYPRTRIRVYNSSRKYLDTVRSLLRSSLNADGRIYKKVGKNCWVLEVNSKAIWLYFRDIIGLKPRKKIFLKLPKSVNNRRLLKHFLAGLFDTDGYFTKTFGIMMNGTNAAFLKEIIAASRKFYSLKFNGPYMNELKVGDKIYQRAIIQLSHYDIERFNKQIPMKLKGF